MSYLNNLKAFWDKTARRYGEKNDYSPVLVPSSYGLLNWYTDFLQRSALYKTLREVYGRKVLDLGCGVGRWSSRLAAAGASVVGVDMSTEMIKRARARMQKQAAKTDFIVASVHSLPIVSQGFEVALSVTVLQHIVDETAFGSAVNEIVRVVQPKGEVVLLEYANKANEDYNRHFPTVTHDYTQVFKSQKEIDLLEVRGVDLSLFLKPFNRIVKKYGKYRDTLSETSLSAGYVFSAAIFYYLVSVACLFSLPIDIALRKTLSQFSEHKICVYQKHHDP